MLKKLGILIYLVSFLFLGIRCEAQSQFSPILTKMENSLFGVDYSSQNDGARLKRIEEVVYGNVSSSPIPQRVNKLSQDLSADLIGQEIKPKRDSFAEDESAPKEVIPKADSSVNYPIVNEMEKRVFNKEFRTVEINQRLAKLEQNVFKKAYNDDLNSRVERLKSAIIPEKVASSAGLNNDDEDDIATQLSQLQDDFSNSRVPNYNSQNSVLDNYQGDSDIVIPLAALEKKVLKKSFPDDTVSNRLTRLELNIFNSTFADEDEQTRFDRVASAYQAQKTSKKYDSNKFAQHTAAAMQVGAILLMILAAVL